MTATHIATIVLAEKNAANAETLVRELNALNGLKVLADHKAFEYEVTSDFTQDKIQSVLVAKNIIADICVQHDKGRKKSLLICDMDSTLIGSSVLGC